MVADLTDEPTAGSEPRPIADTLKDLDARFGKGETMPVPLRTLVLDGWVGRAMASASLDRAVPQWIRTGLGTLIDKIAKARKAIDDAKGQQS